MRVPVLRRDGIGCSARDEDTEMWREYASDCFGVAVTVTSAALKSSLRNTSADQLISSPVSYIDDSRYTPFRLTHGLMRPGRRIVDSEDRESLALFLSTQSDKVPEVVREMRQYQFVFRKRTKFAFESEYRFVLLKPNGIDFDKWESAVNSGLGVEYGTLATLGDKFYINNAEEMDIIRKEKPETLSGGTNSLCWLSGSAHLPFGNTGTVLSTVSTHHRYKREYRYLRSGGPPKIAHRF